MKCSGRCWDAKMVPPTSTQCAAQMDAILAVDSTKVAVFACFPPPSFYVLTTECPECSKKLLSQKEKLICKLHIDKDCEAQRLDLLKQAQ